MSLYSKVLVEAGRLKRHFKGNPTAGWIGVTLTLLVLVLIASHGGDEKKVIFQEARAPDYKNASILGNPAATILRGEERQFSKQSKTVLDTQKKLLTEVEGLKAELALMKGNTHVQAIGPVQGPPSPQVSPSPTLDALGQGLSPIARMNGGLAPPPDEFGSTRIRQDRLTTSSSATERPRLGLGFPSRRSSARGEASLISFPVKSTGNSDFKKPSIILPSGSYVKGVLLTGVEAPEGKTYPILIQLDYAYIIPNHKRLDLSGCFIIAKSSGNLSTERVEMQATKLSCVSKRGGMFERDINGFTADGVDNAFGIIASVNSKQDRVAAMAFLASLVGGIGKAIQQAQTTSQVTPLGGSQSVLTGDQGKYIAGGAASDSANMVAQWYLKHAEALLPTLNVGSGATVWLAMAEKVELPKEYFTQNGSGGSAHASIYSYFTRILD